MSTNVKPYYHEFKIPRVDGAGNEIRNEAGDVVYDVYVYSFARMSMNRVLMAKKFFLLHHKQLTNPPNEPNFVEVIADRQSEIHAYMAILMKKIDDKRFEPYNPATIDPTVLDRLAAGEDAYTALMECENDFFINSGLSSIGLNAQSQLIIDQSMNIVKAVMETAAAGGQQGLNLTREALGMVLDAALKVDTSSEPAATS